MPTLEKLLEVQEFDLACDALRAKRRDLPERAESERNEQRAVELDRDLALLDEQKAGLSASERVLAAEVAQVAVRAKASEDRLYSGAVTIPKELEGLQEELRGHKQKQSELEDQELELMEQIEQKDAEVAENREARTASDAQGRALDDAIRKAEAEIDGELAEFAAARGLACGGLPAEVLEKYEGLRSAPLMGGRPAARLEDGTCLGCRVKLPVLTHTEMQREPVEALLRCTQCRRILVR